MINHYSIIITLGQSVLNQQLLCEEKKQKHDTYFLNTAYLHKLNVQAFINRL